MAFLGFKSLGPATACPTEIASDNVLLIAPQKELTRSDYHVVGTPRCGNAGPTHPPNIVSMTADLHAHKGERIAIGVPSAKGAPPGSRETGPLADGLPLCSVPSRSRGTSPCGFAVLGKWGLAIPPLLTRPCAGCLSGVSSAVYAAFLAIVGRPLGIVPVDNRFQNLGPTQWSWFHTTIHRAFLVW